MTLEQAFENIEFNASLDRHDFIKAFSFLDDYKDRQELFLSIQDEGVNPLEGFTEIPAGFFKNCTKITSVSIPNSVNKICEEAFLGCAGLEGIDIPPKSLVFENSAFYKCTNLKGVYITDLVAWCSNSFDGGVSNPVFYATKLYLNNQLITTLDIPNSINTIPARAFESCKSITSVIIPNSIKVIGSKAFDYCYNLAKVEINDLEAWCHIKFTDYQANPLQYAQDLYLNGKQLTEITIPNTLTRINNYVFSCWEGLKKVTIPDTIKHIGQGAFEYCKGLTEVNIPKSVTSIEKRAFYYCQGLKNITFGDSLEYILNEAFEGCTALNNITIPPSVKDIHWSSFPESKALKSITIDNPSQDIVNWIESILIRCPNAQNITVKNNPYVSVIDSIVYSNDEKVLIKYPRSKRDTSFTLPDGVTSIKHGAFWNCRRLEQIHLNSDITSIGGRAFEDCRSLQTITIPDTVSEIPYDCFKNCLKLTSVKLGNTVQKIRGDAFKNCSSLSNINIPASVEVIGDHTFAKCRSLRSIEIPSGKIREIESYAFYDAHLNSISIGEGIEQIGSYAFASNPITLLKLPSTLKELKKARVFDAWGGDNRQVEYAGTLEDFRAMWRASHKDAFPYDFDLKCSNGTGYVKGNRITIHTEQTDQTNTQSPEEA